MVGDPGRDLAFAKHGLGPKGRIGRQPARCYRPEAVDEG